MENPTTATRAEATPDETLAAAERALGRIRAKVADGRTESGARELVAVQEVLRHAAALVAIQQADEAAAAAGPRAVRPNPYCDERGFNPTCPACSGHGDKVYGDFDGRDQIDIYTCLRCGGTFGAFLSRDHVERLVGKCWANVDVPAERTRYFDFYLKDGSRIHGWHDPASHRIVQLG